MQTAELREKSAAELRDELLRLRKEQFALRMQRASEQLPQTHLIAVARREIARVKTVMRERGIGAGNREAALAAIGPNGARAPAAASEGAEHGEQSDGS